MIMQKEWFIDITHKMGGKVIFNYIFSGDICNVQKIINGIANPEWVEIQVFTLMCD